MFRKSLLIVLVGAVWFTPVAAHAFDWFGGRLSIGGGFGRAKPKLPYSFQDSHQDGDMWTAHMKYFLNNDFSVVASYADLEPYMRGNKEDQYRFRPVIASLRYNLFHHLPISPYLTAGAGYAWNKHETPGLDTVKWSGFAYQAGIGFEFFITEGTSFGAEALYHSFEGDGNHTPYRLASLVGTANFYFGPGPSQKRTEEALAKEKAEAERARAEAEAAKAKADAAQQQALAAQQGMSDAQKQALAAQQGQNAAQAAAAAAQLTAQQLQEQARQAQAEVDQVKQMVASKQISPITFKTGSAELLADSSATLDKVAEIAKKYPDLKLRVEGHTDSVGSDSFNQQLSQDRANSVRDYLVAKGGVSADQVTPVGFGETRPIASNDTADGRAQNRRVEFIFFLK